MSYIILDIVILLKVCFYDTIYNLLNLYQVNIAPWSLDI